MPRFSHFGVKVHLSFRGHSILLEVAHRSVFSAPFCVFPHRLMIRFSEANFEVRRVVRNILLLLDLGFGVVLGGINRGYCCFALFIVGVPLELSFLVFVIVDVARTYHPSLVR